MRLFVTMATLLLLGTALPAPAQDLPRGRVDWQQEFPLAMQEALLTRRPVLVSFYTTWCGWCRKLEGSTFQDPQFVDLSKNVITVRIDGDKEKGLVGMFRVTTYPTTLLLTRQGRELVRIVGYKPIAGFLPHINAGLAHRESLEEVQQLAAEHPDDARAQYSLGDVYLALQRYEEARSAFQEVFRLAESSPNDFLDDSRLDMALSYLFNYDFERSIGFLEGFLESHPDSDRRDQGLFFYGVALLGVGRTDEGLARIDEAIEITDLDYIKYEAVRLKKQVQGQQEQG